MEKIIFSLTSSKQLAKDLSKVSGIPLGESEVFKFADEEIMARCKSRVQGKICYVVQSTVSPSTETIFEVLMFADALKNAGAFEVVLIAPYFGYSRQDRVAVKGEPITAKLVAKMIEIAGISRVISADLHTQQIQGFFSIPVTNIDTSVLFGRYFARRFDELGIAHSDVCVVSPDHGSANRGRDVSSELNGASLAVIDKRRPAPNKSEVINVVGDVRGKVCLVVDDIIDTGGTVNNAVDALLAKGATQVYVAATHAIFSTCHLNPKIKEFVTTDSVEKEIEGAKVLSLAELIAQNI
jgi:ribose-phosphate pyrophosphokinase